jgi:uncharacterized protein
MIEMAVDTVRINLATQQRVLILKEKEGNRYFFLWIAHAEAYAIAVHLQGTTSPRPLTHDLLKNMLEAVGIQPVRVEITNVIDEVFYALLVLNVAGRDYEIDSRPSDAIALAVRVGVPIFMAEDILARLGVVPEEKQESKPDASQSTEERVVETASEGEAREEAGVEEGTAEAEEDELQRLRTENERLQELVRSLQERFLGNI